MTPLLLIVIGLLFAYALYIASLAARQAEAPEDFLHGGGTLPGWTAIFAGAGVVLAGFGVHDHLLLMARFGLQAGHEALALVLVALCAALLQKRLWLASRLTRITSPVALLGTYYGSIAVRLFLFAVLLLFAIPFAAESLGLVGDLLQTVTAGVVSRGMACWVFGGSLFLCAVIGGWRGVIYVVAAQSLLLLVLIAACGAFSAVVFEPIPFFSGGIVTAPGVLADRIPGVIQYATGIGKQSASGGWWTTMGIFSQALALLGIVVSPGFGFLGNTTATRTGFAFSQVWMVAGLACGSLLLAGPMLAAGMSDPAGGAPYFGDLIERFAAADQLTGICLTLLLLASLQIAVVFFAVSGANMLTLDLVLRFVLPDLPPTDRRLAGRIVVALVFAAMLLLASFGPGLAAILATVTLSLSAQLLPAMLGLCWVPWFTRAGVVTGLIGGTIIVVFTEPPGLIGFEGLFLDLPWGRWPLTIHSAGWGLALNLLACVMVSLATQDTVEGAGRARLHGALRNTAPVDYGASGARTAKWALTLLWTFFAIGPGAILGNDFFSKPMFSDSEATLGVPSLWVWQIMFWLAGVMLTWWLAYPVGLSVISGDVRGSVTLDAASGELGRRRAPRWISRGVEMLGGRTR